MACNIYVNAWLIPSPIWRRGPACPGQSQYLCGENKPSSSTQQAVYIQLLKAIGESQTPERVKLVRFFCIESRKLVFSKYILLVANAISIFVLHMKDKYISILRYLSLWPRVGAMYCD